MNFTWDNGVAPPSPPIGFTGWVQVSWRLPVLCALLLTGVTASILLRGVERPLYGRHRPWTPFITQWFSRAAVMVLGIHHRISGQRMKQRGAVVANHSSWLDIFVLNARKRVYFVSKSEVAHWPGIGFLARLAGTVFINRNPRDAGQQRDVLADHIEAGHRLLFFPEGTSTDNFRVLPFRSTLFQAFFDQAATSDLHIQPVTVIYSAPSGEDPRFYGWWGDMEFTPHLLRLMAARRRGEVQLIYHPPVRLADFAGRKPLAAHLENIVRAGMPPDRRIAE